MGSPENRQPLPESSISRVHLSKEGQAALIFSSWEQLATSFQQFTSEDLQHIHLSAGEVAAERKLRREGKGALSHYSPEEMKSFSTYYETVPTTAEHVEKVLNKIKTATNNGNTYTTESGVLSYGRVFYGSRVQVDPLVRDETPFYKVAVGSEFFGISLEESLEEAGIQRATQRKYVSIEYAQKEGKFSVDFNDVSRRLRTVLQSDDRQLSGESLTKNINSKNDAKEKIIDLGDYEGFYLRMHARHDDGFTLSEGHILTGRVPMPVEGGPMAPTLDISIASSGLRKTIGAAQVSNDIIFPDQRQAAQDLAERLAEAFGK